MSSQIFQDRPESEGRPGECEQTCELLEDCAGQFYFPFTFEQVIPYEVPSEKVYPDLGGGRVY